MSTLRRSSLPVPAFAAVAAFALLAFFLFAPGAQAQSCDQVCVFHMPCDGTSCTVCMGETIDGGCISERSTTCSAQGMCGGCAVTSSRTATQRYKYGPQDGGAHHCIGRQYWYGYTNRSQYQRYTTEVVTINYQTQTCNGVVGSEQEVSRSSQYGECYEFTNGACQSGDIWQTFAINGKECYF